MKQQTINFKRGPDKGPRDTRSDKGKRRKPLKNIKKRVEARQKRVAARKELAAKKSELERRKTDLELADVKGEQLKRKLETAATSAKVLGGVGIAGALATKKGRQTIKKAASTAADKAGMTVGRGVAKGIEETGKVAGKAAVGVGKGFYEGATGAGRQARKNVSEGVGNAVEKATETGKRVVKRAQDDIETTKRVVNREPKPYGEQWKGGTNSSSSAPARSKGIKERLKEKAQRDRERRKKMLGFSEGDNPETIEFAAKKKTKKTKKKNVRVKSYRRKDGTVVRASTRKVDAVYEPEARASRRIGTALHDVGTGLLPVASAAATAAGAYGTILGAKDRHRVINRDLSALGESRKFLALGGSLGNLGRGVGTVGLTRRKLADRERRTAIYEKSQDLFEKKLGIEDRKEDRLGS